MGRKLNLHGQTFGMLTVVSRRGADSRGDVLWRCRCTCGGAALVKATRLAGKHTTSCGCTRSGMHRKYPFELNSWRSARQSKLGTCDVWGTFRAFMADMGPADDGDILARIDTTKPHSPENCWWVPRKNAVRSRRPPSHGTSAYPCVSFDMRRGKWAAQYRHGGERFYVGSFDCEHVAALTMSAVRISRGHVVTSLQRTG